jgi:putative alpha-1,2-mannosidase
MKRSRLQLSIVVLLITVSIIAFHPVAAAQDLTGYVNTLIGTSYYEDQFDVHDYGNTAPFAGPPFAHTPWTAQTRDSEDKCKSAYYYFDEHWQGMRRSHWMSGSCTIDYGSATIIPSLSNDLNEALTFHKMDHSAELSTPAYYRMNLAESSMIIEAASDLRSGIMKVTPSEKDEFFYLIFKASDTMYNESSISMVPTTPADSSSDSEEYVDALTISSPVHRWYQSKGQFAEFSGHHYFKTSRPACEFGIIEGYTNVLVGALSGVSDASGTVAAYLKFESRLGEVRVATGTSFLNVGKARENLYAELETSDFIGTSSPGLSHVLEQDGLTAGRNTFGSSSTIFDIERLAEKVSKIWEKRLGAIKATPFADGSAESVAKDIRGPRTGGQTLSGNSSTDQLVTFYTALWHTQLLPRIVSDYDGQYLSFGDKERAVQWTNPTEGFSNYYDDFSMWDIFRAQIPLFNLVYTDVTRDMVTSLLRKAEQGGWLPIFPAWHSYTDEMIGDHCAVLIADSFLKGILPPIQTDNLFRDSYEYLVKNAMLVPSEKEYLMGMGRRALKSYVQYGFIPLEDEVLDSPHPRQQVSRTLEYSYDDYVVSQMASLYSDSLLKETRTVEGNRNERDMDKFFKAEESRGVAAHLSERSQNYRWVVDGDTTHEWYKNKAYYNSTAKGTESVNFVRGRYANLTWTETFDSFNPAVYYKWLTETNVWQYSFSVLHDVEGLVQIYGGARTVHFTVLRCIYRLSSSMSSLFKISL